MFICIFVFARKSDNLLVAEVFNFLKKSLPQNIELTLCFWWGKSDIRKSGGVSLMRGERQFQKFLEDLASREGSKNLGGGNPSGTLRYQARPDIRVRGFWKAGQHSFFDVKAIISSSEFYSKLATKIGFARAEAAKRSSYGHRIFNIEHRAFYPLIYSITGRIVNEA